MNLRGPSGEVLLLMPGSKMMCVFMKLDNRRSLKKENGVG